MFSLYFVSILYTEMGLLFEIVHHRIHRSDYQYHCCWWPGDARDQGISNHGIHMIMSVTECTTLVTMLYYSVMYIILAFIYSSSLMWVESLSFYNMIELYYVASSSGSYGTVTWYMTIFSLSVSDWLWSGKVFFIEQRKCISFNISYISSSNDMYFHHYLI